MQLLHLNMLEGVGPATIARLLTHDDLYQATESDLIRMRLSERSARLVVQGLADKRLLDRELELIESNAVSVVTLHDEQYPDLLRHIEYPPPVLYYKGVLSSSCALHVACIGSRKASDYARTVAAKIIPELVVRGCTIVSGGARGADSFAHAVALESFGSTIAVLGSGLLRPYPPENKALFDRICTSGALVSPFSLLTQPFAGNFPARNRIIAGLSRGVLVLQAGKPSGTYITAQFALEQGRDVFAVPGAVDDPLSVGCHELIQQGAQLVLNAQDILGQLSW